MNNSRCTMPLHHCYLEYQQVTHVIAPLNPKSLHLYTADSNTLHLNRVTGCTRMCNGATGLITMQNNFRKPVAPVILNENV